MMLILAQHMYVSNGTAYANSTTVNANVGGSGEQRPISMQHLVGLVLTR